MRDEHQLMARHLASSFRLGLTTEFGKADGTLMTMIGRFADQPAGERWRACCVFICPWRSVSFWSLGSEWTQYAEVLWGSEMNGSRT